jgi:hypothetical protein
MTSAGTILIMSLLRNVRDPIWLHILAWKNVVAFESLQEMERYILNCWRMLPSSKLPESVAANKTSFEFFSWLVDFIQMCETLISKSFRHFYAVSTAPRRLWVRYFSSVTPILWEKIFHTSFNKADINSYVEGYICRVSFCELYNILSWNSVNISATLTALLNSTFLFFTTRFPYLNGGMNKQHN